MGLIRRGRDLALEADWYGWLMHVGNNISHIWMQRTTASAWRGSRALSLINRDIKIISRKRSHTACLIHFISYTATSLNPRSFVPPSVHPFQHLHCPSITEAHVILSFSCPANRIGRFTWKTQTLCKKKGPEPDSTSTTLLLGGGCAGLQGGYILLTRHSHLTALAFTGGHCAFHADCPNLYLSNTTR